MKIPKLLVCVAVLIITVTPLALAQIRPDLVEVPPPPPPIGPNGEQAQPPQMPATAQAPPAQAKPSPKKAGEAQLFGSVTDQSGAVLTGATITVTGAGGSRTAVSNDQGQYSINLPPGAYNLSIATKGFKEFKTEGLNLAANQDLEMDGALEPAAAAAEKVEVVGNSVGQVETEKAEVSGTITSQQIQDAPLNGRNFVSLLTLAPGVSNQSQQDEALVGVKGSVKFSVNGGRVEYNTFSVDGSDVLHAGIHGSESTLVVYPSLDAINELKVLTSNYGAQYGRSASGTILVDTKSGADTLHGSLYYFGRNEIFNSRNYFDQTIKAPLYRKNDFGGTIGGPVYIPKVYEKKNRTFFFFSEEARLEKDPTDNNFNQAVPSLAERPTQLINADGNPYIGADFSDVCPLIPPGQTKTTFNRAQFPDCPQLFGSTFPFNIVGYNDSVNPIGQNPAIDPVGKATLDSGMIPLPNASVGCNSTTGSCYDFAFAQPTYWRQELLRVDHDITPGKLRATFRYIHDSWDTTEPRPIWGYVRNSFPTVQGRLFGPGTSSVARLTHTISPTLLNEIVVSYTSSHISLSTRPAPGVDINRPDNLGQGYLFNNGFGDKLSGIQLTPGNLAYGGGFRVDAGYAPWQLTNPTYSFRDDLSKVIGRHNVQTGVQVILGQRNEINATNGPNTGDLQGVLTFSNFNSATVGNEFANLLLGDIQSFQQDSAQRKYYNSYEIIEPYVQDDWKVNSHLTVSLGIRFSLFGNYHEQNHNAWNWDPAHFVTPVDLKFFQDGRLRVKGNKPVPNDPNNPSPLITNGLVQCGVNGVPDTCQSAHRFNPAPRVGFAWDPRGDGKTSIRGGYGIFFEHGTGSEANTGSLVGSAPLNLTMTQLAPSTTGLSSAYPCIGGIGGAAANCFSGEGAYPIDLTSIPRKAIWPYVQQWSFGVQREVSRSLIIGLGYVGSKGSHLTAVLQPNAFPLAPQGVNDGIQLSGNPYPIGQPIVQSTVLGAFDCNNLGTLNNPVFQVNGVKINKTQPAYLNMIAACENLNASGLPPINSRRPFIGIQKIFSLENVADSNYHAFQATLRKTRGPVTVDVSYSFSHSIDDSSDRNDTTTVNPLVVAGNKASSNFDQRHLINVSYTWQLPKFKFDSSRLGDWANEREESDAPRSPGFFDKFVENTFSGWAISGVTTAQSGIPYSVINAGYGALGISVPDNAGVAGGISSVASFPDVVGNIHGSTPDGAVNSRSFGPALGNAAAFAAPRGLTFGDAGRNVLNNPSRLNFDMTLFRTMKVHEATNLEFRAEIFNVFNHTQFRVYDPSTNFGNGANNTITCYGIQNFSAAGDSQTDCLTGNAFLHPVNAHRPRTMQFGLKLSF
ncbi:MAG TPA: carboxypeptidase regulatory-like domain-containing protein [Terriglobales bacterium]|nr:carboxypeptidase regulatory-like domain-containing protein [Terriglobales bacterium]